MRQTHFALLWLVLAGMVLASSATAAPTIGQYTAAPAVTSASSPVPNILLIFDNSGSMHIMAYSNVTFSNSKTFTGMFDPTECYKHDDGLPGGGGFEHDPAANGANPPTACGSSYPWSGNVLNYVTMRRMDIAKQVMTGGNCRDARDSEAKCATMIEAQNVNVRNRRISVATSSLTNLIPQAIINEANKKKRKTLWFLQFGGSTKSKGGWFCVDDDKYYPWWGRLTCKDGSSSSFDETIDEPSYRMALKVPKPSGGVLQQIGNRARFALMIFEWPGDGGPIIADMGTSPIKLAETMDNLKPWGTGTPLAEVMYEGARYFAQISPPYSSSHYSYTDKTKDPYWFAAPQWASTSGYVDCCKSYVLLFTDGEPWYDGNVPSSLRDYGDNFHGNHCSSTGCNGHRTSYSGNGTHYLDDVAYWAHTNDLRQATVPVIKEQGKDIPGFQNLTLYPVFAFGRDSELLKTAAKGGGFEDINGNNKPDLQQEWDKVINATGAAGSDGIPDTYFESSNAQEMETTILAAFQSIIQKSASGSAASVLASSASGEGAVYQSFYYPKDEDSSGNEVKWTGYTHGLFIDALGNLREDSDGDAGLVYKNDKIVRTRYDALTGEVLLDRYDDSNGDGLADSSTPSGPAVELRSAKTIWEAGDRLRQMDFCNRNILTWADTNGDGKVDGGERIDFNAATCSSITDNSGLLDAYLNPGVAPFTATNIIDFVRGKHIAGLRDRRLDKGAGLEVWKLGDSVHARPIVAGPPQQRYDVIYGDSSYSKFFKKYKNRRQVAYVGGNDGMVHGFNAGYFHRGDNPKTSGKIEHGYFTKTPDGTGTGKPLGDELFGFIPQELLPHLKWLTDPSYAHVYYVDLTPKVTDARIFADDATHPDGWGTILMGGFRMGGSCGGCTTTAPPMTLTGDFDDNAGTADTTRTFYSAYFVLDITDPEASDYPKLLWSFSSADLGLTTTVPSMLRVSEEGSAVSDNTKSKWYMTVGSGPTGYGATTGQKGKVYAIDLKKGPGIGNADVVTMNAELMDSFMGTPLTIDRDYDYRVEVAYFGGVIPDTLPTWRGKLYRLTMNTCSSSGCSADDWGINDGVGKRAPTELLDEFPPSGTKLKLGPIASRPAVALDDSNNLWVFAGTGRHYSMMDKSNTEQQYFVGVKDSVMNSPTCTQSNRTNCHDNNLLDVSNAEVCLLNIGNCGKTTSQVTNVSGASTFPSLIGKVGAMDGWYTTLPQTGERALVSPLVLGGLVIFPTFVPATNSACGGGAGDGYLYALYYMTGSAYESPVIGTKDGTGGTKYVKRKTYLGAGMPSAAAIHKGEGTGDGKVGAIIQDSLGKVARTEVDADDNLGSRFKTWWKQRF